MGWLWGLEECVVSLSGCRARGSSRIRGVMERASDLGFFKGEIRKKWRNGLTPRKMHG